MRPPSASSPQRMINSFVIYRERCPAFDQSTKLIADRTWWRVFWNVSAVNFSSLSGASVVGVTPQIVRDTSCHELFGMDAPWKLIELWSVSQQCSVLPRIWDNLCLVSTSRITILSIFRAMASPPHALRAGSSSGTLLTMSNGHVSGLSSSRSSQIWQASTGGGGGSLHRIDEDGFRLRSKCFHWVTWIISCGMSCI